MDKQDFYEIIKKIHNTHGYINRHLLEEETSGFSVNWELSKNGGLKRLCKELGLTYRQYSQIDPNDILLDANNIYQQYGKLTIAIYEKHGKYSKNAIRTGFGSFANLLNKMCLPGNVNRMVTAEEVETDFKEFYEQYKTTSSTKYRQYGNFSQPVIERLFGSWSKFIAHMGYVPDSRKYGASEMLSEIKMLFDEYGYLSAKLINDNCQFTYQAVRHHFDMKAISQAVGVENAFLLNIRRESSGSKELYNMLVSIYGKEDVESEYYEEWLRNPKTRKIMYVDFYIKSERIAIEYDGKQHFEYIEFIHRNYKNFYYQVYRDRIKEKLLAQHNVRVIRFRYDEPLTEANILTKIKGV